MYFGFHTFQAVREGIRRLLERKLHSDEPEYYPLLVGLICLYGRPFTNNRPVGPLTEDIVPQEHIELHRSIIHMRHQLFAHSDVSAILRPDDYPNELVFENNGKATTFNITRFLAEPAFLQLMVPLLDKLIEKTGYHSDRLGKKFRGYFGRYRNLGQFRLNVVDPSKPVFAKLSKAEKAARQEGIRSRPDSAEPFANNSASDIGYSV